MAKINKRRESKKKLHASGGVSSCIVGLVGVLVAATLIAWAYLEGGKAGIYLGAAGFLAAMLCIIGLVFGIKSFYEVDRRHLLSVIGTFLNGALLLGYMWVYSIGALVS